MICPAISLGLGGWLLYQNKKKIRPETGDSVPGGVATLTGTGTAAGFVQNKNGSEPPAGDAAQSGTGSQPPATERKEDRE